MRKPVAIVCRSCSSEESEGNSFYGPGSQKLSMTGLGRDQGNWVTGGGAIMQGSGSDFDIQLERSNDNFSQGSAVTEEPSLTILRPYQ